MNKRLSDLINTRLQPGAERRGGASRFNGFPLRAKPLKRFWPSSCRSTGLKPGVNEKTLRRLSFVLLLLTLCLPAASSFAAQADDAEYEAVAAEAAALRTADAAARRRAVARLRRELHRIQGRDFFTSPQGEAARRAVEQLAATNPATAL